MQRCEQYKGKIEDILRDSDLSTITTKFVRHSLESQIGISLVDMKKEINSFIEDIFMDFQERKSSPAVVKKEPVTVKKESVVVKKEPGNKVVKKEPATKKTRSPSKKTKEPKERKPIDWPLLKVNPPLSDIIHTQLCSRPQTVKKMWEYIRENKLQSEKDKRVIICDAKFKKLCDGKGQITGFSMNKYIQNFFEVIPKEEQSKYKQILFEQERANGLQ